MMLLGSVKFVIVLSIHVLELLVILVGFLKLNLKPKESTVLMNTRVMINGVFTN